MIPIPVPYHDLIDLNNPAHLGRVLLYAADDRNTLDTCIHDVHHTLRAPNDIRNRLRNAALQDAPAGEGPKRRKAPSKAEVYWLYQRPVSQFRIVGQVVGSGFSEKHKATLYLIDDGSGILNVRVPNKKVRIKRNGATNDDKAVGKEKEPTKGRGFDPNAAVSAAAPSASKSKPLSAKQQGKQRAVEPPSAVYLSRCFREEEHFEVNGDGSFDIFYPAPIFQRTREQAQHVGGAAERIAPDDARIPLDYRFPSFDQLMKECKIREKSKAPAGSTDREEIVLVPEQTHEYVPLFSEEELGPGHVIEVTGTLDVSFRQRVIVPCDGKKGISE